MIRECDIQFNSNLSKDESFVSYVSTRASTAMPIERHLNVQYNAGGIGSKRF